MERLEALPVATLLVVLYALIGGTLVILSALGDVNSDLALSFRTYLEQMAIAVAGLAVGRGLVARNAR